MGEVVVGDVSLREVVVGGVVVGEVSSGVVRDGLVVEDVDSPAALVVERSVAVGSGVAPEAPTGERVAPAMKNNPVTISATAAATASHREAGREAADSGCCLISGPLSVGAGGPLGLFGAREYPTARAGC